MDNKERKIQYPIYLPPDLLETIKQRASKKDWSINKWIIHALTRITRDK
jgi:predicted HicB family RNase H-like nuclease